MPIRKRKSQKKPPLNKPQPHKQSEIIFSFKYLDLEHPKFRIDDCNNEYFNTLLKRLRDVCKITFNEFIGTRSSTLKSNNITWEKTSEPEGFQNINSELWMEFSRECSLTKNEHGRIHGFLTLNTFHIVWFDPHHNLFPRTRR